MPRASTVRTIAGFAFWPIPDGLRVYRGRRCLGTIYSWKENNGRHCFRLGAATSQPFQTFRGRLAAARALLIIDSLVREAGRKRLSLEMLILRAWEENPHPPYVRK